MTGGLPFAGSPPVPCCATVVPAAPRAPAPRSAGRSRGQDRAAQLLDGAPNGGNAAPPPPSLWDCSPLARKTRIRAGTCSPDGGSAVGRTLPRDGEFAVDSATKLEAFQSSGALASSASPPCGASALGHWRSTAAGALPTTGPSVYAAGVGCRSPITRSIPRKRAAARFTPSPGHSRPDWLANRPTGRRTRV
jgi:hypothetical protein